MDSTLSFNKVLNMQGSSTTILFNVTSYFMQLPCKKMYYILYVYYVIRLVRKRIKQLHITDLTLTTYKKDLRSNFVLQMNRNQIFRSLIVKYGIQKNTCIQ